MVDGHRLRPPRVPSPLGYAQAVGGAGCDPDQGGLLSGGRADGRSPRDLDGLRLDSVARARCHIRLVSRRGQEGVLGGVGGDRTRGKERRGDRPCLSFLRSRDRQEESLEVLGTPLLESGRGPIGRLSPFDRIARSWADFEAEKGSCTSRTVSFCGSVSYDSGNDRATLK